MIYILLTSVLILFGGLYYKLLYVPVPEKYHPKGKLSRQTILIAGIQRSYLLYTPANKSSGHLPLIIALHGSNINGEKIRIWTGYGLDRAADECGFEVVYPDAIGGHWNDIRNIISSKAKKENIDDVRFINELSKYLIADRSNPIYGFGYSNGGVLLYRIIAESPGLFNSIAVISANLPVAENRVVELTQAAPPLLLVSGTKDPIIPYNGGRVKLLGKDLGRVLSSKQTAEYYAASHGKLKKSSAKEVPGSEDSTRVFEQNWADGKIIKVRLYTIENGGHVVASKNAVFPGLMGKITNKIDSVNEAIKFFGLDNIRQ